MVPYVCVSLLQNVTKIDKTATIYHDDRAGVFLESIA